MTSDLARDGFFIRENFLSADEVERTLADFNAREFRLAGVGAHALKRGEIRRDEIHWFERGEPEWLVARLEAFRVEANRELFLGLERFEGHYARYPAGGFYLRHYDNHQGKNSRVLSVILYLNRNWQPGDGGELVLDLENGRKRIEPRAGTLVGFLAREIAHEVLPCLKPRFSFAGWYHCQTGPRPL